MRRLYYLLLTLAGAGLLAILVGNLATTVHHVAAAESTESPLCSMPPEGIKAWLPITPAPQETSVPGPRPESDCGFYRPAWQRFLVATQPTANGPAFLDYPSFYDIFPSSMPTVTQPSGPLRLSLTPRDMEGPNVGTQKLRDLLDHNQAGIGGAKGGILIDQNGRFIYYAIHVNPAFRSFLTSHNLTSIDGIAKLDPNLSLPVGVAEFKSAWMIVKNKKSAPTYFVVPAKVQRYVVASDGSLAPDLDKNKRPRFMNVWAALIALHVVFTLPGHPEMIWSTFEHIHADNNGQTIRDNAPAASHNPSQTPPATVIAATKFLLYKGGTTAAGANKPLSGAIFAQHWDAGKQSFTRGGTLQTSVYRPYPGSKSDGKNPDDSAEDDEVILINRNAGVMFQSAKAQHLIADSDLRQNYRLVGAVWLNDPLLGATASFTVGRAFINPIDKTTDEDNADLAGEGRLGSTAMESFTQFEDGAPSCFSCHDTQAVHGAGGKLLLPPGLLNVSHVVSRFKDLQASHGN